MKVVYNGILGGWFIVRGAHQTPISGRFETKEAALAHLRKRNPFHTGLYIMTLYTIRWTQPYTTWEPVEFPIQDLSAAQAVLQRIMRK